MELASEPAGCCHTAVFLAAAACGNAALVCDQLAADDRVPDLCADGMGYMGLAGAATGADANAELGVGVAALGAQPDPDDHFFPRASPLAVRVEETGGRLQVRPARAGQECAHLPVERSILGQCHLHAFVRGDVLDVL